jgi:hypothetical protein
MTKLNSILLAAICCSTLTTLGQSKIEIGAEGSPSIAFQRGNEFIKKYHSSIMGFSGGVSFQYNFEKIISLRTGLSYEQKGSALKNFPVLFFSDAIKRNITTYFRFNYLTVPVLARASFGKKRHFFVNAGPYFSYLLEEVIISSGEDVSKERHSYSRNDGKWDMGVCAGLGAFIPLGKKLVLTLEMRDNLGLYNIDSAPVYGDEAVKNNSTNLLIGLAYGIGT